MTQEFRGGGCSHVLRFPRLRRRQVAETLTALWMFARQLNVFVVALLWTGALATLAYPLRRRERTLVMIAIPTNADSQSVAKESTNPVSQYRLGMAYALLNPDFRFGRGTLPPRTSVAP